MFIVLGMGPDPTLVCMRCGETVLELRPDGQKIEPEGGGAPQDETLQFPGLET